MYAIFLLPLALSLIAGAMVAFGDYHWLAKGIVVALIVVSVLLQFVPVLRDHVHFLVPMFIQILVGGGYFVSLQRSMYI